jgi:hypothetical protein
MDCRSCLPNYAWNLRTKQNGTSGYIILSKFKTQSNVVLQSNKVLDFKRRNLKELTKILCLRILVHGCVALVIPVTRNN